MFHGVELETKRELEEPRELVLREKLLAVVAGCCSALV